MKSLRKSLTKMTVLAVFVAQVAGISSASAYAGEHADGADWYKLNWVNKGPIQISYLWGDLKVEESAYSVKLQPGQKGGKHAHSEDYHGVTIQRTWFKTDNNDNVNIITVGSHIKQSKNEWHMDECAGPEICILLIHFEGPRDIFFPDEKS